MKEIEIIIYLLNVLFYIYTNVLKPIKMELSLIKKCLIVLFLISIVTNGKTYFHEIHLNLHLFDANDWDEHHIHSQYYNYDDKDDDNNINNNNNKLQDTHFYDDYAHKCIDNLPLLKKTFCVHWDFSKGFTFNAKNNYINNYNNDNNHNIKVIYFIIY